LTADEIYLKTVRSS